ncbi:MAG: DUF86 domain-containing protein [Crocosphaera sp.]|nr:DUF86 domain-containing protein [Crocosphaera sp.]
MRDDRERLQDILDAIKQIEKYAVQGKERFIEDELIQTWVVHHLMIIGEASSRISQETKEKYPDIPWVGTIDVRNIITHEYFRVDLNIIWIIVNDNLPDLKKKIENIS